VISGSFTASQKVVVVVRARRGRRLSLMSVGLTLNGGTLVAQNRDERRDNENDVNRQHAASPDTRISVALVTSGRNQVVILIPAG
jgi:hypothetical protein